MIKEKNLPNGWAIKPMTEVVTWGSGGTPKATESQYYDKLITNAKACGLTRTAYLRRLLNGYDLKPRPSTELEALRTEIHQIGNNINQIARKANAGFASREETTRALRMLDEVYGLLYEVAKR